MTTFTLIISFVILSVYFYTVFRIRKQVRILEEEFRKLNDEYKKLLEKNES